MSVYTSVVWVSKQQIKFCPVAYSILLMGGITLMLRIVLFVVNLQTIVKGSKILVLLPFVYHISLNVYSVSERTTPPLIVTGTSFDGIVNPTLKSSSVLFCS